MANGVRFDGSQYGWVDNYIASDPGALTVTFFPDIVSGPMVVSGIYTRHLSLLVEYNDEGQCRVVAQVNEPPESVAHDPNWSSASWFPEGYEWDGTMPRVELPWRDPGEAMTVSMGWHDDWSGPSGAVHDDNRLILMDHLGNTATTSELWPDWPGAPEDNPTMISRATSNSLAPGQTHTGG